MRIIGVGIDFVKTSRIERFILNSNSYGLKLVFSDNEIKFLGKGAEYMAGRFAVKEALLKAAQIGFTKGFRRLSEIEIYTLATGAPAVQTYGKIKSYLVNLGVNSIWVSISHDDNYTFAVVILSS